MKKTIALMLGFVLIATLTGCGQKEVSEEPTETLEPTVTEEETVNQDHPEWVKTSLTIEDLERIEDSMPPLSYVYQTYDMQTESIVDTGSYEADEWENTKFFIPEYETMVNREVTSSGIEDDMIYTVVKMTLEDGTVLNVLYINEPDTLFCRAISVENWDKTTLYSNFVYDADVQ